MTSKDKILNVLQAQCAKREYCRSDIRRKALDRCDGDSALADEIVDSLVADKFVDDARYAAAFAREKSSLTGWGPVKIKFALLAKGLSRSDIDAGLSEIDDAAASDKLERLMQSKWKSISEEPDAKLKLIRFALSRGYEYSRVDALANEISR